MYVLRNAATNLYNDGRVGAVPLSVFRTDTIIREDTRDWTPTKIATLRRPLIIILSCTRAHR